MIGKLLLTIIIVIILILFPLIDEDRVNNKIPVNRIVIQDYKDGLRYLKSKKVPLYKEMIAQSILESGWEYSSNNARYHNVIGMNHTTGRFTNSIGVLSNGSAIYRSKKECLDDLIIWYWYNDVDSSNIYSKLLQYASDSTYIVKLKQIVNKL